MIQRRRHLGTTADRRARPAWASATAAVIACGSALAAWLVHPDNQLGVTRPTTILASLAIAVAAIGVLIGAVEARSAPRSAPLAVLVNLVAIVAALGALAMLLTLPYGD
jgi:peptidoglycan/LPS O-acetylase OafA/YrhL